jgi:hypothetical protein
MSEHLPNRIMPTRVIIVTESLIDRLVERFTGVLDAHTARLPAAIPFAAPVRKLAEAAVDVLALGRGVPMVPRYDAELAAQRVWYGERSAADLEAGLGFPHVEAILIGDDRVRFTATDADGDRGVVTLPVNDAEEFALHVLSAVDEARTAVRSRVVNQEAFANVVETTRRPPLT